MRLACVQTNVAFGQPMTNAHHATKKITEAKSQDAELIVFPEAFLTGYCVSSPEQAQQIAIRAHCDKNYDITDADESLIQIQAQAVENDVHIIVGFAGFDDHGLFNAAALIEPDGRMRRYIKTHLPCLGYDRFAQPGNDLPVFQTSLGCLGILICYDLRPPEAARVLALKGADLILLPTNWPDRKGTSPSVMCPTRSIENKIFFASCNRIGEENGFSFRGESAIIGLGGETIADANTNDTIITADLDLTLARNKNTIIIPNEFESNAFTSRRPELYKAITD